MCLNPIDIPFIRQQPFAPIGCSLLDPLPCANKSLSIRVDPYDTQRAQVAIGQTVSRRRPRHHRAGASRLARMYWFARLGMADLQAGSCRAMVSIRGNDAPANEFLPSSLPPTM